MKIVRYINNQKVDGENIPSTSVDNPTVVRILRDVNRRIKISGDVWENGGENGDARFR